MTVVHPLHSICPYFAMFPPGFVERYVLAFTEPGDIVFDPFSGRGTTVFESLLLGRRAYGLDINPVAACVSAAKADPPSRSSILRRIADLRQAYADNSAVEVPTTEFFATCSHPQLFVRCRSFEQLCRGRRVRWTGSLRRWRWDAFTASPTSQRTVSRTVCRGLFRRSRLFRAMVGRERLRSTRS